MRRTHTPCLREKQHGQLFSSAQLRRNLPAGVLPAIRGERPRLQPARPPPAGGGDGARGEAGRAEGAARGEGAGAARSPPHRARSTRRPLAQRLRVASPRPGLASELQLPKGSAPPVLPHRQKFCQLWAGPALTSVRLAACGTRARAGASPARCLPRRSPFLPRPPARLAAASPPPAGRGAPRRRIPPRRWTAAPPELVSAALGWSRGSPGTPTRPRRGRTKRGTEWRGKGEPQPEAAPPGGPRLGGALTSAALSRLQHDGSGRESGAGPGTRASSRLAKISPKKATQKLRKAAAGDFLRGWQGRPPEPAVLCRPRNRESGQDTSRGARPHRWYPGALSSSRSASATLPFAQAAGLPPPDRAGAGAHASPPRLGWAGLGWASRRSTPGRRREVSAEAKSHWRLPRFPGTAVRNGALLRRREKQRQ